MATSILTVAWASGYAASMVISIARDGQEIGEWTEDQVRAFYQDGQLLGTDNYWREGMAGWEPLRQLMKPALPQSPDGIEGTSSEPSQPPSLSTFVAEPGPVVHGSAASIDSLPSGWTKATFPRRCGARVIDYLFITLLDAAVFIGLFSIIRNVAPSLILSPGVGGSQFFISYAICVFVFYSWDVVWISWTGSTIGKWLYGLRVVNADGTTGISRAKASNRSLTMLGHLWFLIGFPLLTLLCTGYAWKQFNQTGSASWDRTARTLVIGKEISVWRRIVAVTLTVISLLCVVFWEVAAYSNAR